jgi:hypothetical protein
MAAQAADSSPADAALAAGDVAGHIIAALLSRAGGGAADLARLECVCRALRRAAAPHWRPLCETLSRAAVLQAACGAGTAGGAQPWRRLYAQLRTATFGKPPPRCRCTDFRFLLDVSYAGQPLLSACLGPFAGEPHAAQRARSHWLGVPAPPSGDAAAPPVVVTAGDVFDWPTRFRASLYVQRCADGALSPLVLRAQPATPVAWTQSALACPKSAELQFDHFLSDDLELDQASDNVQSLAFSVRLFLQAQDAAEAASEAEADATAPLFFRTPAFADAANDSGDAPHVPGLPRRPLHESSALPEERGCFNNRRRRVYNTGWGHTDDGADRAPIDECALSRRVVLRRRGGVAAALAFEFTGDDGGKDMSRDAECRAAGGGCVELCASLDRLAFAPL